jgi:RNA polymerase sigma-70 factor (ECF subfamily)
MADLPRKPGEPIPGARCLTGTSSAMTYQLAQPAVAAPMSREADPFPAAADPDAELVTRWQAGDASAFEALVRRHEQPVFRLALRMLGNREEAEDVAQEALLSLHRHGHRFRRESRFSTFVYRVTANAALNRRRTLGRSRARERLLAERESGYDPSPTPRNPADALVGAEAQTRVQEALQQLSPDLRLAVVLFDIEGLPYGEIARVLEVPEGTVKSRIHRARNALREKLRAFVTLESEGES